MGASPFIQVYCSGVLILKQPKGLWQGNPVMQGHHQYLMRRTILAAQLSLLCQNLIEPIDVLPFPQYGCPFLTPDSPLPATAFSL